MLVATDAKGSVGAFTLTLNAVTFAGNSAPMGSYLAIPGSGAVRVNATATRAIGNVALTDAGAHLSDNVTSVWTNCRRAAPSPQFFSFLHDNNCKPCARCCFCYLSSGGAGQTHPTAREEGPWRNYGTAGIYYV